MSGFWLAKRCADGLEIGRGDRGRRALDVDVGLDEPEARGGHGDDAEDAEDDDADDDPDPGFDFPGHQYPLQG